MSTASKTSRSLALLPGIAAIGSAEILVGGEGAAELVERHGASLIGVALIEEFPDLGLVLVVPLGRAHGDAHGARCS